MAQYTLKESTLRNIIKKVIRESVGMPSEEHYYINVMVPRIKSWMEEVYNDWGGLQAVSPEALTDFSNRNDYEETLDAFAHEFNIDREHLKPILDKALSIAYNKLKEELSESKINEREVTKFTPYTPEEKEKNFSPFTGGDNRDVFQRNPAYEKALRDAEERRKQRQQHGESVKRISESEIRRIVKESVKSILKEDYCWWGDTKPIETIMQACAEIVYGKKETDFEDIDDRASYELYQWANKTYEEAEKWLQCNSYNTPINGGGNW